MPSVLDQSGLRTVVWIRCVSILQLTREAANGPQPSIPADQDVLLHASNILESILQCIGIYPSTLMQDFVLYLSEFQNHLHFAFAPSSD